MRHLLRDDDLNQQEQMLIIDRAIQMKVDRFGSQPLAGPKTVAVLFDKSSTRTRVSFAAGIAELGGYALVMDRSGTQFGRGEPISDTAHMFSRMTAAIAWRTFAQSDLEEMARHATVPVINALTDSFHPCQILADWMTIKERFGHLKGIKATYLGDGGNNMAHSYLLGGAIAGMHITIAAPASDHPNLEIWNEATALAKASGGSITVTENVAAAVTDADVLMTDTWVSMGDESDKAERIERMQHYSLTQELVSQAADHVIVMHCLPAYRGLEISAEVIDGPNSVVVDEAENRLHVQKALMEWLLAQAEA